MSRTAWRILNPREPAEIVGGNGDDVLAGHARVVELSGKDVTEMYIKGAYQALRMAQELGALLIVLKRAVLRKLHDL